MVRRAVGFQSGGASPPNRGGGVWHDLVHMPPTANRTEESWEAQRGPSRASAAEKLGLSKGNVVQEFGWDEDCDDELRFAIEDAIDSELIEDAVEAVDAVLQWFRDDDGDLTDVLVDALADLAPPNGQIWLLTPKVGREGTVDPADISEAALTAGLSLTGGCVGLRGLDRQQARPTQGWTEVARDDPSGDR